MTENLLVVPLAMSRHWYRYHQLFAELLRTELRRSEPGLVANLHRRAAADTADGGAISAQVAAALAAVPPPGHCRAEPITNHRV